MPGVALVRPLGNHTITMRDPKQSSRQKELDILNGFIQDIRDMKDLPIEFSDRLWNALVDRMTVYTDGKVRFLFKNGATVTLEI